MKTLNSSMAGTVFKVMVSVGEEVTAGQTVIVLESMKMEIPVDAEFNGKVSEVLVAEGDFVNEGDAVISFEA